MQNRNSCTAALALLLILTIVFTALPLCTHAIPITTDETAPAPVTNATDDTSSFPWGWLLFALLAAILIIVVIILLLSHRA